MSVAKTIDSQTYNIPSPKERFWGAGADGMTQYLSVLGDKANQMAGTPFINVQDSAYGATGDGSDEGTEIQAAIDAIGTTGGILFFPPGTYATSSTLDFSSVIGKVTILGCGVSASVLTLDNATMGMNFEYSTAKGDIVFRDIKIQGNESQPAELISFEKTYNIYIHNCHFKSAKYLLAFQTVNAHVHIYHNTFEWAGTPPADAAACYVRECTHFNYQGNSHECNSASTIGFYADGANEKSELNILGNTFNGTHGYSILFGSGGGGGDFDRVIVANNIATSVQNNFFRQANGTLDDSMIINNIAKGAGSGTGILISVSGTNVVEAGNHITNFSTARNLSGLDGSSGFHVAVEVPEVQEITADGVSTAINAAAGYDIELDLEADTAITWSNLQDGARYYIRLKQTSTYDVTNWAVGDTVVWTSDGAPDVTGMGVNGIRHICFKYEDGKLRGEYGKVYSS